MTKKEKQSKKETEEFKLMEGTALKNVEEKDGRNKVSIWVRNSHLHYEHDLKMLQIELMKLQLHMKTSG